MFQEGARETAVVPRPDESDLSTFIDADQSIQQVWQSNLKEQVKEICDIIEDYPYISIDTAFPGVVLRPCGRYSNHFAYHYACLHTNVNVLKLIQLGLSFFNERGERPPPPKKSTWQFNFKFSEAEEFSAPEWIARYTASGVDWEKHAKQGIDPRDFSETIMMSGALFNDDVYWISFHGGFDFGYVLKMLTWENIPSNRVEFFTVLKKYFPNVYDLKVMMRNTTYFAGGVQLLADRFEIKTNGIKNQAGIDSLVTGCVFFKFLKAHFEASELHIQPTVYSHRLIGHGFANGFGGEDEEISDGNEYERFKNLLYGLGGLDSVFSLDDTFGR